MTEHVLHRSISDCVFDPRRACGSHARTKLAYNRRMLEKLAEHCNIPNYKLLSLDALCKVLKARYLDQKMRKEFIDSFNKDEWKEIPIPVEVPYLNGTLTASNAAALSHDKASMEKLQLMITLGMDDNDPVIKQRAQIAAQIFFPDKYETSQDPLISAFKSKMFTRL
jgi:hypothetical protein